MYDDYMKYSCAFLIGKNEDIVMSGQYGLEKFRECLDCKYFDTSCEKYVCRHDDGKQCLLQVGTINHFEKKEQQPKW